jgi:hypothetical protein
VGQNKWKRLQRQIDELRGTYPSRSFLNPATEDLATAYADDVEDTLLDALSHIHADLVAIRRHLGIEDAGCEPPRETP